MLVRIDNILTAEEIAQINTALADAPFVDGGATAGALAKAAKHNRQLAQDAPQRKALIELVGRALQRNPAFVSAVLPCKLTVPLFSRYEGGEEYGAHVDNAVMFAPQPVRSDVAMTIFLDDPASYDGGELTIDDSSYGRHRIKLPPGCAFTYPATSRHRVTPVTRGRRQAVVVWVQSLVRDPGQRRILFDMDRAAQSLRQRQPDAPEVEALSGSYHNLLRMWTET